MNIEDIRTKYQCDALQTFAKWKEWVRKTKPSQAQAHIVKAVAPNGSKYERLIGGYTDAQNHAFDLVSHGYKNVKVFKSVNAGPMKLLRNFSSPLHGAKFKDSCDSVDEIRNKYQCDAWNHLDREMKRKIISHLKTRWKFSDAIINRFIRDFDGDFSMFIKEKMSWPEITKFLDTRAKKVDVNPYSSSYRHSLLVEKGKMKQPGNKFNKLGSGKNPLKIDSVDEADRVERIRSKYSTDAQDDKKFFFQVFTRNGKLISKIKAPDTISSSIATRLAEQESKRFKKNWYKCQIVDQNGRSYETYYNKAPSYNGTRELAQKNMDSVDEIRQKYQEDKLLITANGFGNEKGVFRKDPRNGLKPFEVNFYIKGKDGKLFKTGRSKMAASLNEAKQWANSESRKYKNVEKVEVKEFRDSVDSVDAVDSIHEKYAKDAAFGVKVKGNEKGSERLTMEKVFKELSPAPAWKKVKKGNTIVIRTNINGKDQDVVTIKYFNPNIVAMTPKGGAANMVALKDVSVMCSKLGVEGRRSYNDSADDFASDASVATFTVKSNRNGSKYGYIEKICKTEAEAKALVDKLKKDGFVAMYRKVMYRDSSDTMDRIRAKYCMDGPGYNFYDLKTALANGDIKPNQRMVSSVGGGMAKTAKEWLDMGVKAVNANKPYALNKIKTR